MPFGTANILFAIPEELVGDVGCGGNQAVPSGDDETGAVGAVRITEEDDRRAHAGKRPGTPAPYPRHEFARPAVPDSRYRFPRG